MKHFQSNIPKRGGVKNALGTYMRRGDATMGAADAEQGAADAPREGGAATRP